MLEGYFVPTGLGYSFQTVKDNSLSPVSYSGHLGRFHLGFYFQTEKWISQFDLYGMGGFQYPDVARDEIFRRTTSGMARVNYSVSYKVFERNSWSFFGGLISHNLGDYRNHNRYTNNQDNFIASFALGPIFTTQRPFGVWSQDFALQYSLGLPFGCYYWRPGYVKPYTNFKISAKDWARWGDFFLLDSRSDLIWILQNNNQIRLSYTWSYTQLKAPNLVQIGGHHLTLSTVFRF